MAMMIMERPRTRVVEKKTTTTIEPEKQDQFYYRLKNIRENDRHFGEHEMTQVIDPRGRKPAHIAVTTSATTTTTANYSWQLLM